MLPPPAAIRRATIADSFQSNPTATGPNPAGFVDTGANNYQVISSSPVLGPGYNGTFTSASGFTSSPYAGAFGPIIPPPPPPTPTPMPSPMPGPTSSPTLAGTDAFPVSVRNQLLAALVLQPTWGTPQAQVMLRQTLESLLALALAQSPTDALALVMQEARLLLDLGLGRTAEAAFAAGQLAANTLYRTPVGNSVAFLEAELFLTAVAI
jgi:hypothetical protein